MQITLAGRNFDLGYKSDTARDQLPLGAAYRMYDWIPQLGSPLRRRGGWLYATADLSALSACTSAAAVAWVPLAGDPHLMIVSDNGKVFGDRTLNTATGFFATGGATGFTSITQRPFWFADLQGMVILQGLIGTPQAPKKYTGPAGGPYTVAALGGSPPLASVGAAYGDWLLLANGTISGTRYANRIWASVVGQPEATWVTGNDFFDMPEEVLRIIPLRSTILVFGYRQLWILSGDTPPPGGNWSKLDAFATGTMDGRSCVFYRDTVVFANNAGVFQTDGTTIIDLAQAGGISQRWQELVSDFNFSSGWSCCAGIYQGNYIVVVHDSAGRFVTCQVCDIQTRTWFEFSNLHARMFAERQSGPGTSYADGHEELFFAHSGTPRAGMVADCWDPTAVSQDGDGAAVEPVIESPFYKLGSPGLKQFRNTWVTHDLRAITQSSYVKVKSTFADYNALKAGVSTYGALVHYWDSALVYPPTLRIEGALTPDGDYVTLGNLAATSKEQRRPVWIRKRALGIGLRISQIYASYDATLAEIEFEARPLTTVRRG